MQGDFITSIKSAYNQFTKAEKKVADYILANPRDVLFMSTPTWQRPVRWEIPVCSGSARQWT